MEVRIAFLGTRHRFTQAGEVFLACRRLHELRKILGRRKLVQHMTLHGILLHAPNGHGDEVNAPAQAANCRQHQKRLFKLPLYHRIHVSNPSSSRTIQRWGRLTGFGVSKTCHGGTDSEGSLAALGIGNKKTKTRSRGRLRSTNQSIVP